MELLTKLILSFSFSPPSVPEPVTDEERGEDRARHHEDRLLAGRLEREQEKVLRCVAVTDRLIFPPFVPNSPDKPKANGFQ